MDRHALPGEDARMAQIRLYQLSKGLPVTRECVFCGREGSSDFERAPFRSIGFRCRTRSACLKRMKPIERLRAWERHLSAPAETA